MTVAPTESNVNIKNAYKWCALLGMLIRGISLIGIIAFVICSALEPWSASVNNMHFTGLLAFLIATKTLWFFIFLAVLFVLGGIASSYGIVKALKSKNKS